MKTLVTRTITTTIVNAKVYDPASEALTDVELTLPRTFKNEEAVLKAAKKAYIGGNILHIKSWRENTKLYGMPEADFIANAEILGEGRIRNNNN